MQRRLIAGPPQTDGTADQQGEDGDERLHHVERAIARRRLAERQLGEALADAAAQHGIGDGVAGPGGVQGLEDIGGHVDAAAVDGHQQVVDGQAGARAGAVTRQLPGHDAFGACRPQHAVLRLEPAGADAHVRDHQHEQAGGDHQRHERAHDGTQPDQAKRVEQTDGIHRGVGPAKS